MFDNFYSWLAGVCENIELSEWLSLITLATVIIGGFFALHKWKESIVSKRLDTIKVLIEKIRNDSDISTIMDIIDWNEDVIYDGKFTVIKNSSRKSLEGIDDSTLFRMIDKTLAHFSFICYLKKKKSLKKSDMRIFDYQMRRLFDNRNICNYLYSLHHWSKKLNVSMSFKYLAEYGVKKRFLHVDFYFKNSSHYTCYLKID